MNISTPQTTPDHPDVGRIKFNRLGGCLLVILGGLLTLAGLIILVFGVSLFISPLPGYERESGLIGSIIFFTPALMIGMPIFIIGLVSLLRKPKTPLLNTMTSSSPFLSGQLYTESRAERGETRTRWGWVVATLGWLCIVWSLTWTLIVLVYLVLRPIKWETTAFGGLIFLLPGFIIGFPLLVVAIWMIRRKRQPSQPTQSPFSPTSG